MIEGDGHAVSVLHLLDHSLPEQSGYSFRSHAIIRELARLGFDVAAITGPKQGPCSAPCEEVDGVRYWRTPLGPRDSTSGISGQLRTIWRTRRRVAGWLQEHEALVIHAHSPCLNGLAAFGHRRPVLYEMRSSWEDAAASVGTAREGALRYRASRALETFVVKRATEVVVICEGLKRELISRGVPQRKITVVPNALPAEMFELPKPERCAAIRARYALTDKKVIGFFGSFFEWEGLDALIEALPAVLATEPRARLLLAGGGRQERALRELTERRGIAKHVTFAGRIPNNEVRAFYGATDVMVFPRVSHRLTNMVTPLKPLEAMAQGRPVLASDVGGHREQIADGETGFLYPAGNQEELTRKLVALLCGTIDMDRVVVNARAKVDRDHRWSSVAERYLPVYERLITVRQRAPDAA